MVILDVDAAIEKQAVTMVKSQRRSKTRKSSKKIGRRAAQRRYSDSSLRRGSRQSISLASIPESDLEALSDHSKESNFTYDVEQACMTDSSSDGDSDTAKSESEVFNQDPKNNRCCKSQYSFGASFANRLLIVLSIAFVLITIGAITLALKSVSYCVGSGKTTAESQQVAPTPVVTHSSGIFQPAAPSTSPTTSAPSKGTLTASSPTKAAPSEASASGPIYINAGGIAVKLSDNVVWGSDFDHPEYVVGEGNTFTRCPVKIENTKSPEIFCSERWFRGKGGYEIPVTAAGQYSVTLLFAEIYYNMTGERSFDVSVEGQVIQANFDIIKAAGAARTAVNLTTTVQVSDGALSVQFSPVKGNAKINAIEMHPVAI